MNNKLSNIAQTLIARNIRPNSIRIAVGELLADEGSLQKEWDKLSSSTILENTKLKIRIIPAKQQCMWCFLIYRPTEGETRCPQCRSVGAKIIHGEEFYLDEE
jgi:Zn finger protein HypA/HybF involved in hydrogenase expression